MDLTLKSDSPKLRNVPDCVRKLVDMLDAREEDSADYPSYIMEDYPQYSMENIWDELLESELVTKAGFPITKEDLHTDDFRRIFQQISRPLLRSILLNTVGKDLYDTAECKANFAHVYNLPTAGGAYIASMYIPDREGHFLNTREIKRLVQLLETYIKAIEIHNHVNLSDSDQEIVDTAYAVDAASRKEYGIDAGGDGSRGHAKELLFQGSGELHDSRVGTIKNLTELFTAYISEDSPAEHMVQSPPMVGNAGRFDKEVPNLFPDIVASNTPKIWGLVWSCLKYMEVDVRMTWAPIILAYEDVDINNGEILGTILAGSMLPGRGFNVERPGTRKVTKVTEGHKRAAIDHTFNYGNWYYNNLYRSILGRPLSDPPPPPNATLVAEYAATCEQLKAAKKLEEEAEKRLSETKKALTKRLRDVVAELEKLDKEHDKFRGDLLWDEILQDARESRDE